MSYRVYYIFITALIPSYDNMIIAALVKKGFHVSPIAEPSQVTLGTKDSVSTVISLRIDTEKERAFEIHDEVEKTLKEINVYYYSLIVSEATDCCWSVSNIKLTKSLPPPLPKAGKPDSSLN